MAETDLITAKTVEEAVSVAKREYEDSRHEVSYEIVEMPKKGFLGLGSKPAKIKVTVSKIMTVQSELGSLVADIKNLKNLTDRDGRQSAEKPAEKPADKPESKPEKQPQQKPQQSGKQGRGGQNAQNAQNAQNQQQKSKNQQTQQPQKQQQGQKPQGRQAPAKPEQPEAPQAQEPKPQKQPRDAQNQPSQKQSHDAQPKDGQKPQNTPKKPAPAAPAVPAAPEPVKEAAEPAAPAAEEPAPAPETTHRSALGNQAGPSRRRSARRSSRTSEEPSVAATGVTVSAPMGLTDFVSEAPEAGFVPTEASSGSRMNNDIRRKNRQPREQAAQKPAAAPSASPAPAAEPEPSRRRAGRRPQNIQKAVNEDLAGRYDIAESDEDYARLDQMIAETERTGRASRDAEVPAGDAQPEPAAAEAPAPVEDRRREAITREEMEYALEFANTLLKNMQLDARAVPAECPEGEDFIVTETADVYPKIDIIGSETGILIGHHGETLDSIQYLVNLSALRKSKSRDGDYVKIVVDIENYRQKREDTLRSLARRMAARAVRYRRNVFLEPMNAYERRIIHSELQTYENVSTHSVGADRDRKIIITYEGPEKAPEPRRKHRGEEEEEIRPQPEKSRRRRSGNAAEAETAEAAEKRERRPKKPTKMPIEQLTDWLPDAGLPETESSASASGEEDTLHVMSALREAAETAAEEAADTADYVEEAAEEAVENAEDAAEDAAEAAETVLDEAAGPDDSLEEKAQALLDRLDSFADSDESAPAEEAEQDGADEGEEA